MGSIEPSTTLKPALSKPTARCLSSVIPGFVTRVLLNTPVHTSVALKEEIGNRGGCLWLPWKPVSNTVTRRALHTEEGNGIRLSGGAWMPKPPGGVQLQGTGTTWAVLPVQSGPLRSRPFYNSLHNIWVVSAPAIQWKHLKAALISGTMET